ncbi:MAG TPA: primosomal protein N' [Vicinamibacterales bacterium]|nr:primosomal protein N' [Vicinamibacterales bacterium]
MISVAVPVPALGVLTYRVPADLAMPHAGARVVVPIGPRTLTGVVLGEAAAADTAFTIKPIKQVLDDHAFVPPDVVKLTEWVSEYYLAGPGATLSAALPPHGLTARTDRFKTIRIAALTAAGIDAAGRLVAHSAEPAEGPKLGKRQAEALHLLKGAPDGITAPSLTERGITGAALSRLKALGLVAIREERIDRDPFEHAVSAIKPPVLRNATPDQEQALATLLPIAAANAFHVALIHGVTGSGKTEVYLRLADAVRRSGRGVLMLVPEIALTPQVAALFRARFGSAVAIQHSGLSDGERHDQWHRIRRGDVDVVIGTRSAVFAPLANPGLLIVDEEHDTSYKQDETPRYHGRDVAIMRGKFANALVVIGSATPTIESYTNALEGRYTLVQMKTRVLDRPMASVSVVSMRQEMAEAGEDVVLSAPLVTAMHDRLDRGEQALILLNRRGFATAVICRQCNATLECPNCSISLTVHSRHMALSRRSAEREGGWNGRCHYCNFSRPIPKVCDKCAAPYMERVGFGTERVEAEVRKLFPQARIARVDRDTVRRKGSLVEILEKVASRDVDILIGTQMIAKGHDFPSVTLVGVISADVGLGLADFRASERTFQLLTQVAGRAGRGERPGQAIVQSLVPKHYAITLATTQNYRDFYDTEIKYRRTMRYPPQVAMVNIVVRGRTFDEAMEGARQLAVATSGPKGFIILGPAPAPLTKLRGEHRVQFFLKGNNRRVMREALLLALSRKPSLTKRVSVDVDPLSML